MIYGQLGYELATGRQFQLSISIYYPFQMSIFIVNFYLLFFLNNPFQMYIYFIVNFYLLSISDVHSCTEPQVTQRDAIICVITKLAHVCTRLTPKERVSRTGLTVPSRMVHPTNDLRPMTSRRCRQLIRETRSIVCHNLCRPLRLWLAPRGHPCIQAHLVVQRKIKCWLKTLDGMVMSIL